MVEVMVTGTREPESLRCQVEVSGPLDRAGIEALKLELRRLLQDHGVEVTAIRVERARPE